MNKEKKQILLIIVINMVLVVVTNMMWLIVLLTALFIYACSTLKAPKRTAFSELARISQLNKNGSNNKAKNTPRHFYGRGGY